MDDSPPYARIVADLRVRIESGELAPGDRVFIVSDGVHQATPGGRTAYGERKLASAIRSTRMQPAAEAVATVMRGLHAYHRQEQLEDDAVIVCLDWRGTEN